LKEISEGLPETMKTRMLEIIKQLTRTLEDAKLQTGEMDYAFGELAKQNVVFRTLGESAMLFFDVLAGGAASVGEAFSKMIGYMISTLADLLVAEAWVMIGKGWVRSNPSDVAKGFLLLAV
jgi:hypothetical protein